MESHRCEYCGNVFDPVKHGVCPNCGAAVSAAVMAKIEREQAASRARVERMKEDVVRRHEQESVAVAVTALPQTVGATWVVLSMTPTVVNPSVIWRSASCFAARSIRETIMPMA